MISLFRIGTLCTMLMALSGCALFAPTTPQQAIADLTETQSGGIFNRLNASPVVVSLTVTGAVERLPVVGGSEVEFSYCDAALLRAPANATANTPLFFDEDRLVLGQKMGTPMRLRVPNDTPDFSQGAVLFLAGTPDAAGAVELDAVFPVTQANRVVALKEAFETLNLMNFEFEKTVGRTVLPASVTLHTESDAPEWQFQAINPQGDGTYTLLFRNTGSAPCVFPLSIQRALFVADRSSGSCYRFAHVQGEKKSLSPGETYALSVRLSDLQGFPWTSQKAGCPVKLCWVFFDRILPFEFTYVPSHHNVIFMRERAENEPQADALPAE